MSNNVKMQEGAPSAQSSINENFAFALDYFMKTEKYRAREYGMKTIWYNHRHESTDGVECDLVADDLYQIVQML